MTNGVTRKPSTSVVVACVWTMVPSGTSESTSSCAFSGAQLGLQTMGAGTFQTTLVPLLLPPLSALMNEVPGGIGRSTATVVGAGATAPAGHSDVVAPCATVQGSPKFGPPLQMPAGFDRQKPVLG